jgi:hypothetical protein
VRPEEEKPQQQQPQPPPPMEQPQNSPLAPVLKKCPVCQREMSSLAQLCPHCGQPNNDAPSQRSRFAYMLLGLLFGGSGIHNFYADQYNRGVGHIMLSVGVVFALQSSLEARSWLGVIVTILMSGVQMVWILSEIIFCEKDGRGLPFK